MLSPSIPSCANGKADDDNFNRHPAGIDRRRAERIRRDINDRMLLYDLQRQGRAPRGE